MSKIWNFGYTGAYQTWTAPTSGYYFFEVWGAQGGSYTFVWTPTTATPGGFGGYSCGVYRARAGEKLYIYVGGKGQAQSFVRTRGGWNGGGSSLGNWTRENKIGFHSTGGGATDITSVYSSVTLDSNYRYVRAYASYNARIIVAGGGGSACRWDAAYTTGIGGHGGGYTGKTGYAGRNTKGESDFALATGGTQYSGGSDGVNPSGNFGYGAGSDALADFGEGGGGWYGGGQSHDNAGGGGSGYIGRVFSYKNFKREMYCYDCPTSSAESTRTTIHRLSSSDPIPQIPKENNGYARITYIHTATCKVPRKCQRNMIHYTLIII